jgi:hypothetical protein
MSAPATHPSLTACMEKRFGGAGNFAGVTRRFALQRSKYG